MPLDLLYWFALFLLLCLSVLGYGLCVLSWLRLTPSDTPTYVMYASAVGYGMTAYITFVLGILQVLYPAAAYTVLMLGLVALYYRRQDFENGMERLLKDIAGITSPPFTVAGAAWLSFIVLFILLNLSIALTPPLSKDALIYHLLGPETFIKNHGIGFISGNFYTNFPFTIEMLFAVGMLLKGPILAKLIHFSFGVLTLVAIFQWTTARSTVSTGLLAGAVYYTLPLVARLSGWAYIDLSLAFFVFVMVTALLDFRAFRHKGFLALAGVFGGLAIGTKYSGIIMVLVIGLGALLFLTKEDNRGDLRMGTNVLQTFFIAAAVSSPWYLKNWILTGNPTYPFLYPVFGGREWSQEMANTYATFLSFIGSGPGILSYLKLPWDICFVGGGGRPDFDGFIGPIFLMVPLLSIAVRPKSIEMKLMLFFGSVYFILWAMLIQQLRFLIPIFPVFSALLALFTHKSPQKWARAKWFMLFFCFITFAVNTYFHVDQVKRTAPHKYLSGVQSEEEFLRSHLPSYPAIEYINQKLTDRDKVLFVFLNDGPYYCKPPYVYDPVFEANTLMDVIKESTSAQDAVARFRQQGITHILLNRHYVSSITSILGKRHRGKFDKLLGLLSTQGDFGYYRLYGVSSI